LYAKKINLIAKGKKKRGENLCFAKKEIA